MTYTSSCRNVPRTWCCRRLEAEADEMWSFVKKKANKQWIWIAMDAITRQIIAFHVGDRSRESAKALWAKIPSVYRNRPSFHTDQYDAYTGVIPAERHKAITKHARKTNHIERFNNTLRQRVSRLVRETPNLDTVSFTYMRSAADCVLRAHPRPS